ncbi:MAG: hypothetical protein AAFX50_20200, partial [Acidobacteriota bacterium]
AQALVTVRPHGDGPEIARKRARAHDRGNPVRFTLEPGRYRVEVREVGGRRRVHRSTAAITAGEETAISAALGDVSGDGAAPAG